MVFKKGHIPWNKGKHYAVKEKNPNWKGGITPINNQVRSSVNYEEWINYFNNKLEEAMI